MADPKTPMTPKAASRIQSAADRSGTNQGFKGRAQSAANTPGGRGSKGSPSGGGKAGGKAGGKGK
jgi:hypothetical protein